MENNQTAEVAAPAAAPVKPKRAIKTPKVIAEKKVSAAKTAPAVAEAPKVKVNVHLAAGVDTSAWTGPSDMINANRQVRIMQRANVDASSLTDRQRKSLYALRKSYAGRQFPAKGFDNGVMAFLAASGLISLSGGQQAQIDGKTYLVDGATPVIAKVTAAGAKFGTA